RLPGARISRQRLGVGFGGERNEVFQTVDVGAGGHAQHGAEATGFDIKGQVGLAITDRRAQLAAVPDVDVTGAVDVVDGDLLATHVVFEAVDEGAQGQAVDREHA